MVYQLPIQWHSGMMLLPQHFQQQNKYISSAIQALCDALPFPLFGVREIEHHIIDNRLYITKLRVIFDNYLYVELEQDQVLEIDLSDKPIYLAMPTDELRGAHAFIPVVQTDVPDQFNSQDLKDIVKLKPNLYLVESDTAISKHYCIKLFEVKQSQLEDYQYPCVQVQTSAKLYKELDNLRIKVHSKLSYIADHDRLSSSSLIVSRPIIAGFLVLLEQYLQMNSHPFYCYTAIVQLTASLTTVQELLRFEYNHLNLWQTFAPCLKAVNDLLDTIHQNYNQLEFTKSEQFWRIPLTSLTRYDDRYLCSASMPLNYDNLNDWIDSCVIASDSKIMACVNTRVLGAGRLMKDYIPALQVRSTRDLMFFVIDCDEQFIVDSDQHLVLYNNRSVHDTPSAIYGYK